MKINFTKRTLDALTVPDPGQRKTYQDTRTTGLVLRHSSNDFKSFSVYKRLKHGKALRVTLGPYPTMSIEQARQRATKIIGELTHGININAKRKTQQRKKVTLGDMYEEYIQTKSLRPTSLKDYHSIMHADFKDWLPLDLASLTKEKILARHQLIGQRSPSRANNAMRVLRAVFNYAQVVCEDEDGQPLFPHNPVTMLSRTRAWFKVARRQSLIKAYQLPHWYNAVMALGEDTPTSRPSTTKDYLLFILMTGLRQSEAAHLCWENVDFNDATFTIRDTKNHQPHTMPLSSFLMAMLQRRQQSNTVDSPYIFPSRYPSKPLHDVRKQIKKVIEASGVTFMLHDLRRTFITIAESLDISGYTLKRLLNHKMSDDVTAGYIVMDVERLRKPMEQISTHILALCTPSQKAAPSVSSA